MYPVRVTSCAHSHALDYKGAKSAGIHALLIDRIDEAEWLEDKQKSERDSFSN